MELYPPGLRKLWKKWDLRVTVLFSLTLQILLIFMGNRRKYSKKLWIRIVVWSAYITADSIATFALGILSSNLKELYDKDHDVAGCSSSLDANTQLSAFWAPFLVLHLGGPDTITAYALEDNELWLRHVLGLFIQTGMALSIFLMSWTASSLSILSLVMFLPGIIKYAERTWVLRSTTSQKRRESSRSLYLKFNPQGPHISRQINSEEDALRFAEEILFISKLAFLDDKMVQDIRRYSLDTFRAMLPEYAFKVIKIELGLIYDMLYTKAPLLYTRGGLVLRMITFILTCLVMVLFHALVDNHKYSKVDLLITYLLIIVAVIHDIYAALLLALSDTFAAWLIEDRNDSTVKTLNGFPLLKRRPSTSTRRWSNKMSQCSLLRFTSKKAKTKMSFKLLNKTIVMGKYWHCEVSEDLRKLIFKYVKKKAEDGRTPFTKLPSTRSLVQQVKQLIKKINRLNQGKSINDEFEFEYSIIIWHIATEVWYYLDQHRFQTVDFRQNCKMTRRVSRYMMYLLVERPSILSLENSTDRINFRDIRKIADKERIQLPSGADKTTNRATKAEACERLLEEYGLKHTGMKREEELIYMAMERVRIVNGKYQTLETRWEKIERAWIDILGYAARKSKGNEHAQQLRRGGELLTHVWLLLCHFGLTDHYLIEHAQN